MPFPSVFPAVVAAITSAGPSAGDGTWPQYDQNPFVISLPTPPPSGEDDSAGGVIATDLTGDGRPDFVVTVRGHVAAVANGGALLWHHETPVQVGGSSERYGLPGHHGPGVQAGEVDGDGHVEVLFLRQDGFLVVADGRTGKEEARLRIPHPERSERWEHAVLASFRGRGSFDLLLQTTNRRGYRMGQYLAAYSIPALIERARTKEPVRAEDALWSTGRFLACAHNGARVADLDGDGRDEILVRGGRPGLRWRGGRGRGRLRSCDGSCCWSSCFT